MDEGCAPLPIHPQQYCNPRYLFFWSSPDSFSQVGGLLGYTARTPGDPYENQIKDITAIVKGWYKKGGSQAAQVNNEEEKKERREERKKQRGKKSEREKEKK